ncbi:MAG TPA: phosphotransacetylase family protein [Syntrophorhabdales bacterium]|nr:phosphotransacetylase family protein [Syntrophorhabdales bacterium]
MAITVYVTSTERFSGKTAFCVGLLRWLKQAGHTVGYMKPISTSALGTGDQVIDEDARFIKAVLGLSEPLEIMSPILFTDKDEEVLLRTTDPSDFEERVRAAHAVVADGKDVVIMEGGSSLREGWIINLAPPRLAELLDAHVLVVVPYAVGLHAVDDLLAARSWLAGRLLGGAINSVPRHRMDFVKGAIEPFLNRHSLPVFAVVPKEKSLFSVTVSELAHELNGEILCCTKSIDELVENMVVGAMGVESALSHFRRVTKKAVVTGGDRPDIQMAALETSTSCLILTGGMPPNPLIIGRAEDRKVPIILTRHDTFQTVGIASSFLGKTRFHQEKKVPYFEKLLAGHMNFDAFLTALGIKTH